MTTAASSNRYEVLDSWRGICALLVALLHFAAYSHLTGLNFFANAYLFVDFFFVLSGFVIAANYQTRLANGFGLARFMILRFGRLYPLYFVTLMAFVGFELLQMFVPALGAMGASAPFSAPRQSIDTIFANVFLMQSFGTFDFLTWNTPGWSIATEFWTYLVFALVVCIAPQHSNKIMMGFLAVGIASLLLLSKHGMNTTYDFGMVRCISGFAAGVVAFGIWQNYLARVRLPLVHGTGFEIICIIATALFVSVAGQGPVSVFAPIMFAIAVLVFAAESGWVSRALKCKPFLWLGTLSYSIYMVHLFVEMQLLNLGKLLQAKLGMNVLIVSQHEGVETKLLGATAWQGDLWIVAMLVLVVGISALSYKLVEVPSREWFRKLALAKRGPLVSATPQTARP